MCWAHAVEVELPTAVLEALEDDDEEADDVEEVDGEDEELKTEEKKKTKTRR